MNSCIQDGSNFNVNVRELRVMTILFKYLYVLNLKCIVKFQMKQIHKIPKIKYTTIFNNFLIFLFKS